MASSKRSFYRVWRRHVAAMMDRVSPSRQRRFHVVTIAIGLLSGLGAVAFHQSIYWSERNLIYRMAELPGWLAIGGLILMPAAGGLVVGFLLKVWAPEAAGSGIPHTKAAYFLKFGRIRLRTAVAKFVLGTVSIGSGGSLGREGPTVHISAALASWVGRWMDLTPRQVMSLIPLGCAGGIAAAFNTPLAAIVLAIEQILGDFKRGAFAGIVLVAVLAAVIERSILGPSSMFSVPEHPETLSLFVLGLSVALGALAGVAGHAFVGGVLGLRARAWLAPRRWAWAMPGLGGLATGCIGVAVFVHFGRMGVFGIGYDDLSQALFGQIGLAALLALLVGKFAATICSFSTGGCGGVFAPSLFIGGMLGGALGLSASELVETPLPLASIMAIVGMGAMFAAVIRAPVTSILIIFELTRDYNLILPIMLANLIAYAIAVKLRPVPLYEALLLQDGINLRKFPILHPSQSWQNLPVSAIMTNTVHTLLADLPLGAAYEKIKDERFKIYPVVDEQGRYVGLVHRKGVRIVSQEAPEKRVRDIFVSAKFPKVYPDTPIRKAAREFVDTEWVAVPVVSRLDEGRVIGIVTLHDITRQQFMQESRED